MNDQAQILRGLMEQRSEARVEPSPGGARARTVAVTSGKGGVGKSSIALNLALSLRKMENSVCLLDANLGLGNIDLMCGLNGYWNLAHVISGARTVREIVLEGPGGIHVIPGASGLEDVADCPPAVQREIITQLDELEQTHDYLVIDTGTGIHRSVRQFAVAADMILVITTPEPTAIADAYATIKSLLSNPSIEPQVLVNLADSAPQAREIIGRVQQTAQTFLHVGVGSAGYIPRDSVVSQAIVRRRPFLLECAGSPASRAIDQLARRVVNFTHRHPTATPYFTKVRATTTTREAA